MMKDICYRFFPSRWKIGRRCFSKSSNAKAPRVLAKEISRRSLRRLRKNRSGEAICKMQTFREFTPHLNPLPFEGRGEGGRGRGDFFEQICDWLPLSS